jgi:RND family efflux transporter MFP subunit
VGRWRWCASLVLVLGVVCGCGGAKGSAGDTQKAPHAAVIKPARRDLSTSLEVASEFQPYQEIDVYAKVSGYVRKLYIDWGTHVKQGTLMAVLEIPELQQQLRMDEADVQRRAHDVANAEHELSRAQADYTVAHLTYGRLAGVQATRPQLISQEEVDIANGKDQATRATVSADQSALAAAQEALQAAKAALDRDQALYAYSRITAPFDGVVTRMYAYTGALLPAGTSSSTGALALCQLGQNNLLRLVIPVPERAVPEVHIGDMVAVRVTALNKTFKGKIVRFSDHIDLDTRTMHTEVQVPNPEYILVPGMYATVELRLHGVKDALTLPVQAVQHFGRDHGVVMMVDSNNTIERREVVLGIQTATEDQILSGLNDNERVIFGELSQYKPGERVTPELVDSSKLQ